MADRGSRLRWQRVEALFERALELAPSDREAFLGDECAGDVELVREVEGLLRADSDDGTFLEPPEDSPAAALASLAGDGLEPGERLGVYRIEGLVAAGGMGRVYRAERVDEAFHKRVAIKVVKRGMDTDEVVRRFRAERQTLADLEHPGIARLLDGGVTAGGLPYLVMEYVEGAPIDAWCDGRGLGVPERLRLFLRVCAAVEFAHRNLVVHRDLKPANVFVDATGEPKLLDFGIAKVLDAGEGPGLSTIQGSRPMTPEYASPEQVTGERVTTATDVYSIGVVLFELLCGRRPYSFGSRTPTEVHRVVCEVDPPLASAVADPERRRGLCGDLDRIVAMALRKEPERRYASVHQLAEDVRRHLDGLPVLARADSTAYKVGKLVRRHLPLVLFAAALLLSLVGGSIGIAWKARDAAREAARALEEARVSRLIADFTSGMLASVRPEYEGSGVFLREMLDEASGRIEVDCAGHPRVEASIRATIGKSYQVIGSYEEAEPHLRRALELYTGALASDGVTIARARCDLGRLLVETGDYDEAERLLAESLAQMGVATAADEIEAAAVRLALSVLHTRRNEYALAEEQARRAHAAREAHLGPSSLDTAKALAQLARTQFDLGRIQQAGETFGRAIGAVEEILGADDPRVAAELEAWGALQFRIGDWKRACELFERAVAIRRDRLDADHPALGVSLGHLADALVSLGRYDEALERATESVRILRTSLGSDHPFLADALESLGMVRYAKEEEERAGELFTEALEIVRRKFGHRHLRAAQTLELLALVHRRSYEEEPAIELYRESLDIKRAALGDDHPDLEDTVAALGVIHLNRGELDLARECLEHRLRICRRALSPGHLRTSATLGQLAEIACKLGDHEGELAWLREDVRGLEQNAEQLPQFRAGSTIRASISLVHLDRVEEALPMLEEAFGTVIEAYGRDHPQVHSYAHATVRALEGAGASELAAPYEELLRED